MNKNYLQEAFKKFELLEEESFDITDTEDVEKANDFLDHFLYL